jgi:hypothetical protein
VRKNIHTPPRQNAVPMESHNEGQHAGYFPRLLCGNTYLWHIRVVIYEKSTINCILCIRQVIEASTPRWTFEGGMRDVA